MKENREEIIFAKAIEFDSVTKRESYLKKACGDDLVLKKSIEALLEAHRQGAKVSGYFELKQYIDETSDYASNSDVIKETEGSVIDRYKLLAKIGEGGFGAVYTAEQLEPVRRQVAVKIIRIGSYHKETVARFEAERQALALMDHPNIAKILDGGTTESGRPYFVMDYIDGPSIIDFCHEEELGVEEILELFVPVCRAIHHAHEKGFIHRDLKPSNILISVQDDLPVPKIIDFGIVKATQTEFGEKAFHTKPHQVIGTPAYMSPEQARGEEIDKRSDLWSFGSLLFECLSGRAPFKGKTSFDTLGAILHKEPEWHLLPQDLPEGAKSLLKKCLTKSKKDRLQDISDARIELEKAIRELQTVETDFQGALIPAKRHSAKADYTQMMWGAIIGAIVVSIIWLSIPFPKQDAPASNSPPNVVKMIDQPIRKFAIRIKSSTSAIEMAPPTLSPDGETLIYSNGNSLTMRSMSSLESIAIPGTEKGVKPFWAPDSKSIGFIRNGSIWKINFGSTTASEISRIHGFRMNPYGQAAWIGEDIIGFAWLSNYTGLRLVNAGGGQNSILHFTDEENREYLLNELSPLPEGLGFLCSIHGKKGQNKIGIIHITSDPLNANTLRIQVSPVYEEHDGIIGHPVYSESGHILFHKTTSPKGIWALPYSLADAEVTDSPWKVVDNGMYPSVSSDGTLTYLSPQLNPLRYLAKLNLEGKVVEVYDHPLENMESPAVSPLGNEICVSARSEKSFSRDLYMFNIESKAWTKLTSSDGDSWNPKWHPSGDRIIYNRFGQHTGEHNIVMQSLDTEKSEILKVPAIETKFPPCFMPDGDNMVIAGWNSDTEWDLYLCSLKAASKAQLLIKRNGNELFATVSPDGKYLAFVGDTGGKDMSLFLKLLPDGRLYEHHTRSVYLNLRWGPSSEQLFFVENENIKRISVQTTPTLQIGPQKVILPSENNSSLDLWRDFDISPDGQHIYAIANAKDAQLEFEVVVVQNWLSEMNVKN